jgi:hypothetical protein
LKQSSFNQKPRVMITATQGKGVEQQALKKRMNLKNSDTMNGVRVNRRQESKQTRENTIDLVKQQNSTSLVKKSRKQSNNSSRSASFWISDAWTSLDVDVDGDGYFSEFSLSFDPDFSEGYAEVYAEVYTSFDGQDWVYLFTTNNFTIYADDSGDYYSTTIELNHDFVTGGYDIAIDLFEVGYSDVVASLDATQDADLYNLPLEDITLDQTWISYIATDLYSDYDNDGFYSQVTIEYDIETYDIGRQVYAEIDIINRSTGVVNTISTQDFVLDNVTEFIDIDFDSGYLSGYYDFELYLIDSSTYQVVTDSLGGFTSMNNLPIESDNYDHSDVEVVVVAEGSGSMYYLLLLLGFIVAINRFYK